jgi:hypothetical protein
MSSSRLREENVLRLGLYAPAFRTYGTWISEKLWSDLSLQVSSLYFVDVISSVTSAWRIKNRGSGREVRVCKSL